MANTKITTNVIADDAITGAKIADDAINSEHYTDGSIDTAHIADDQVTLAKMAGIARGKIIYGDSSGNPAVLTVGSAGTVLTSDGTDISWAEEVATNYLPLAGGTMTGNTRLNDNVKHKYGSGDYFQVYHDGSNAHMANSSGNLTLDVAGNIILDADGAIWNFKDGGTEIFQINSGSQNANLKSTVQDKDIRLQGNDGGSTITALTLDMSDAGTATFNHDIILGDNGVIGLGASNDLQIWHDGSNSHINNNYGVLYIDQHTNDGNLILRCDDGSGGLAEYIALDGGAEMVNMKQKTRVLTASPTILELETTNSSSYKFYIENRYDASNTVNFVWNTTTLMRFTSNYNALALMPGNDPGVAIGTYDDEGHKLNIYRGSSGNCSLKLKTSGGGDPEIHLDSAAANRNGIIKFFDNGTLAGRIDYHHNGDRMELQAGSSTGRTVAITGDRMYVGGITAPTYAGVMVVERDQAGVPMFTVRAVNADAVGAAFHVNSTASGNNSIISCWNNSQDGSTADQQFRIRNDGTCFTNNGNTSSLSDRRLKKNIVDYTYDLSKFKSLRTRKFDWENKELHGNKDDVIGFIAQEVDAVDSRWVMQDQLHAASKDVPLVDADLLTFATPLSETDAMYVSVIQQLITRLEAAEAKITALEG